MIGNWWRQSIARRMLLALLLACTALWASIYFLGFYGTHATESGSFDRDLKGLAVAMVATLDGHPPPPAMTHVLSGFDHLLESYHKQKFVVDGYMAFQVWRADGSPAGHSRHAPPGYRFFADRNGFVNDTGGPTPLRVYVVWTTDRRYRVDITQTLSSRQIQYDSVMLTPSTLGVLVASLVVLWLLALLTVHLGLRPLRRLSLEMSQRRPDDLQPVATDKLDRELVPVVQNLNQTLARLRQLLNHERNALADLAHELRTPLAIMTHQIDAVRHAQDEPARQAAAHRLEGVLQRTNRLVHQLLELGRLQATTEAHWTLRQLPDLVRETLATHAPLAAQRSMTLSYAGPDQLECSVPGASMELIVDNLVRNAIRHGKPGGQIEVRLSLGPITTDLPRRGPELIELTVLDDGPGVPPNEWPRLFERFRRGARATGEGSGLGLAIVVSAARQLGGRVHAHPGLNGTGLGVSVTWPLHPAACSGNTQHH
ncbi:ATP-binding protein [Polaromonas sp.]|uniref:sensor histidine kinase n=1 Tax=Polaromonas sp. TaxID=1869339 RepID=UPI0024891896|nr:ATP-binding protein [Polaromonas sp.]MDI1342228.1 ATP-binding protein [Polaromonas sp.]